MGSNAKRGHWLLIELFKKSVLANDGHDTRALQHYLGHKNIQHTVRYTDMRRTASRTFGGTDFRTPPARCSLTKSRRAYRGNAYAAVSRSRRARGRHRQARDDFRFPLNHLRRLTGSRREHGLDGLDGLLDLLVAHRLDAPAAVHLHFPRH